MLGTAAAGAALLAPSGSSTHESSSQSSSPAAAAIAACGALPQHAKTKASLGRKPHAGQAQRPPRCHQRAALLWESPRRVALYPTGCRQKAGRDGTLAGGPASFDAAYVRPTSLPLHSSQRARLSRMEQVLGRSSRACTAAASLRRRGTAPVLASELRRRETRAAPRAARPLARGARGAASAAGDGVGVVLVDHGSRKAESNDQLVRSRVGERELRLTRNRRCAAATRGRIQGAHRSRGGACSAHGAGASAQATGEALRRG